MSKQVKVEGLAKVELEVKSESTAGDSHDDVMSPSRSVCNVDCKGEKEKASSENPRPLLDNEFRQMLTEIVTGIMNRIDAVEHEGDVEAGIAENARAILGNALHALRLDLAINFMDLAGFDQALNGLQELIEGHNAELHRLTQNHEGAWAAHRRLAIRQLENFGLINDMILHLQDAVARHEENLGGVRLGLAHLAEANLDLRRSLQEAQTEIAAVRTANQVLHAAHNVNGEVFRGELHDLNEGQEHFAGRIRVLEARPIQPVAPMAGPAQGGQGPAATQGGGTYVAFGNINFH